MIVEGSFDGFGFLILIVQQTFQWLISRQGANNLAVSSNIACLILIAVVIVSSNNWSFIKYHNILCKDIFAQAMIMFTCFQLLHWSLPFTFCSAFLIHALLSSYRSQACWDCKGIDLYWSSKSDIHGIFVSSHIENSKNPQEPRHCRCQFHKDAMQLFNTVIWSPFQQYSK